MEDTTRTTVNLHFAKVHPAENFASLEDMPKSRWERSFESDKSEEEQEEQEKEEEKKEEKEGVKLRKRERSPASDQNQNQTKKIVSSLRVNILNIDVNDASTDTDDEDDKDEKLKASSTKRLELSPKNDGSPALASDDEMSSDHRRYAGALIPLPYIDFPRAAMFYSCTVCPAEPTFTNLSQFEMHRESEKHRIMYGERFRGNNCQHFPDGAYYNVRVDLNCCYCPAKVGVVWARSGLLGWLTVLLLQFSSRPSWLRHFTSHQAPERNPEGEKKDYCGECRMPVLSSQHYERHKQGFVRAMTKQCKFCDMTIFKDQMYIHNSSHQEQHFR